jgi:undecaprenyl-diphosphatase
MSAQWDLFLFRLINGEWSNPLFDLLMPVATHPKPFLIPVILVGVGLSLWGGQKGRYLVATALLLLLVSNGVNELLKLWVQRPRPCRTLEAVRVLVGCSGRSFSFPSSHATNTSAQALLFAYFYRPLVVPLLFVVALVGYSRVYVGVHYPADVLAGFLVGLGCAGLFIWGLREGGRRWRWFHTTQPMTDDHQLGS